MTTSDATTSARLTRPLQVLVAACSLVFAVSSALHGFAVVDTTLIETMMRMAQAPDPVAAAPGFTAGFRIVGASYVLGNAVGVLALWTRPRWLWWWVLAVNATQGLGYLVAPSEIWMAVIDRHGPIGLLPFVITDGGAALLTLLMLATLIRFRAPWAHRRAE